jgi:uncharacterized protein (UPF0332 family)
VHNETRLVLARYRIEQARECLDSAMREIEAASYKHSANRSYYCIFHAMRAVLVLEGFDSKKHSGIISAFRQRYVKTGIFSVYFSDIISGAFDTRNSSDYEDFFVISKSDVQKQLENAETFLAAVETYIEAAR